MKIKAIQKIAKQKGVVFTGMAKSDLIRAIQRAEGNFDCYGSAGNGYCDQEGCLWRENCLEESVVLKRTA